MVKAKSLTAERFTPEIIRLLQAGGVGVIPTDTIYGISARAYDPKAVERIYKLRERNRTKPMIVLVASPQDLRYFGVRTTPEMRKFFKRYWPGKVSVVLPCSAKRFAYLHRGQKSLAFRLPARADLRKLLEKTGPLVSTSVNFEGGKPALTIAQAKKYFGVRMDFYLDVGRLASPPSTVVTFTNSAPKVLRAGAVPIPPVADRHGK